MVKRRWSPWREAWRKASRLSAASYWHQYFTRSYDSQLRQCPCMNNPERAVLVTAADYCGRAAIMSTTPMDLLRELRNAVAALSHRPAPTMRQRPVLHVIEGGLFRP